MELYILLYIWSIVTSAVLIVNLNNRKVIYIIANLVPLIFFATFRASNVGTDLSPIYLDFFYSLPEVLDFSDTRMEYGYTFLNYLVYQLTESSIILLFIIACLTYIPIFVVFHKCSSNVAIAVITFIGLYIYCTSLNAVRQYLAISFMCVAYYHLYRSSGLGKSLGWCIVAVLFHKAAVVMIPLIFLYIYQNSFKMYLGIVLGITALYLIILGQFKYMLSLFPQYSLQYALSYYSQARDLTASIILPVVTLIIFTFLSYYLYKNRNSSFDRNLAFFNIIFLLYSLSWIASFEVYIFYRFVYFFEIFFCFAIPYVVEKFFRQRGGHLSFYMFCHVNLYVSTFKEEYINGSAI